MAKVKVLVLYPTGFQALGVGEVAGSDVVELEEAVAATVVATGWAEYVKAPKARKTISARPQEADS
jgi:hypothetical protein